MIEKNYFLNAFLNSKKKLRLVPYYCLQYYYYSIIPV